MKCSDGSTISDVFTTSANVISYAGSLVIVETNEDGEIQLNRISGDRANIEVWRFPKLGVILVYDPRMQADVGDSKFKILGLEGKAMDHSTRFQQQPLLRQ